MAQFGPHKTSPHLTGLLLAFVASCAVPNRALPNQTPQATPAALQPADTQLSATQSAPPSDLQPEPRSIDTPELPASLSPCPAGAIPEGTLLLTSHHAGIFAADVQCESPQGPCPARLRQIFSSEELLSEATWSPNGQAILFAASIGAPPVPSGAGGVATEMRLFTILPTGGSPRAISTHGGFVSGIDSCSAVDRILYERSGRDSLIYMVDTHGNGTSFNHEEHSVGSPSCAPLGQDIAFISDDARLYLKHIGTSEHEFIADGAMGRAAWSPDQALIAFTHEDSDGRQGTCLAAPNLDSNDPPQPLAPCPVPDMGVAPAWSPDGRHLVSLHFFGWDRHNDLILSDAPSNSISPLEFATPPRVILHALGFSQSPVWIGPDHIIALQAHPRADPAKALVIDVRAMCLAQSFTVPQGAGSLDWLPAE